jgi:hypothetical protein
MTRQYRTGIGDAQLNQVPVSRMVIDENAVGN